VLDGAHAQRRARRLVGARIGARGLAERCDQLQVAHETQSRHAPKCVHLLAILERLAPLVTMTRCVHTGLSIPECSCRACLIELVRAHAPRPAQVPVPAPPGPAAPQSA
jgi:hypothetical protein